MKMKVKTWIINNFQKEFAGRAGPGRLSHLWHSQVRLNYLGFTSALATGTALHFALFSFVFSSSQISGLNSKIYTVFRIFDT